MNIRLPAGEGYGALSRSDSAELDEGLRAIGRAQPLTQLRLAGKPASLRIPLPMGEVKIWPANISTNGPLATR